MTIKSNLTLEDYKSVVFSIYYSKPSTIILNIIAACSVLSLLSSVFDEENHFFDDHGPVFLVIALIVFAYNPFRLYNSAKKLYVSNTRIQEPAEYEFNDNNVKITGLSYSSEVDLNKSYKIQELKKFFLIYESTATMFIIPKKDMSTTEITDIRGLFKNVTTVKLKRLRKD